MLSSQVHFKKRKGFTLVELMISLVISSIIMLGVVSLYSSSRKGQKTNESLARIQENLRFAADMMTRDIRMAGYAGCKSSSVTNVTAYAAGSPLDFNIAITGFEGGISAFPTPRYPATGINPGDRVAGTDAIEVRRVSSTGCKIVSHTAASATIFIDAAACDIEADEVLAITDCSQTSIFRVTGPASLPASNNIVHNTGSVPGPDNCSKFLGPPTGSGCSMAGFNSYTFNQDARVHKYIMHGYFIGVSTSGLTKSLYVVNLDKGATSATELVEGIEDLQITYGVNPNLSLTDPFPVRFVKASDIVAADIPKIVAVKFGMLLASVEDTKTTPSIPKPYTLSDTTVTPTIADRRLHFTYNTTVKIRNKGIR